MKTLTKLFAILTIFAVGFTSCKKDDDNDPTTPNITLSGTMTKSGNDYVAIFRVTCDAPAKINEVTAKYYYNNGGSNQDVPKSNITMSGNDQEKTVTVTFPQTVSGAMVEKLEVTARTNDDGNLTRSFNTPDNDTDPGEETTPLDTEASLEFKREGGSSATGVSQFGLTWTTNTKVIHAQIRKGSASKFVQLPSSSWTSIVTKEALKSAIDGATDMSVYSNVSAEANGTYNDVLGVLYNGTYYMLHITSGTVATGGSAGTTITISGQYKK